MGMHLSRIPNGLRYYTGNAARLRRSIEDCAISVFESYSYEEIITPSVDYYALFEKGMGAEAHTAFRFTDSDGRMLALRPDVTSSVARAAATLLAHKERPLRLCYVAPVFHQQARTLAEWRRETTQLGCELIGAIGVEADTEPLIIVAETLRRLELGEKYCITLSSVEVFNGIAENLDLSESAREQMRSLIDARDTSGLMTLLNELQVDATEREMFARVTRLSGKRTILDEAKRVITNPRSRAALDSLEQIWSAIEARGLANRFEIDLGDVSGLDYYTGILFKVYVEGAGFRIGRGGRYDGLTSAFGRAEPAVGFVLDLDALTDVIARERIDLSWGKRGGDMLTIAIGKGRLQDAALELCAIAGIAVPDEGLLSRRLAVADSSNRYRFIFVKPADVPVYVEHGIADCGIVGRDVLLEADADLLMPLDLRIAGCRMVVAARNGDAPGNVGMKRVATKYPRVTASHFAERGIPVEIIELSGSVELAPVLGLSDCIVDLVETGRTLNENGLHVVEEIFESTARLVVNRASYQLKSQRVTELIQVLNEAINRRQ